MKLKDENRNEDADDERNAAVWALLDELPTVNRLADLGDYKPLERWKQAIRDIAGAKR